MFKPIVKYPHSDKHPAQTEMVTIDEIVGTWTTKPMSGALPKNAKEQVLYRIVKLREAVKSALEEANSIEVKDPESGERFSKNLLGYVFAQI